ncbi:MAG: prepilin peptidase [Deltaproteobacteria bacterium]|nr:MAG: prepilin peptidase [Deltaproteobacteria bacterium]
MGVLLLVLVFALGASVGSFLNVVIYRVPIGASIVRPASRCPSCETPIRLRHNVPILGWLALGGRCAVCRVPISARYPLIELASGLLAVALFTDFAGGIPDAASLVRGHFALDVFVPFVLYFAFVAALVAATFIDLDWFILPDSLTLGPLVFGPLAAYAAGRAIGITWSDALVGAALGASILLLVIAVYAIVLRREGLGGGDWKLLAMIGGWLGWQALPFVLLAGSVQGLLFAAVFRRSFAVSELPPDPLELLAEGAPAPPPEPAPSEAEEVPFRRLAVPFGPFLALGAVEFLLFRDEIRDLFLSAVRGWH